MATDARGVDGYRPTDELGATPAAGRTEQTSVGSMRIRWAHRVPTATGSMVHIAATRAPVGRMKKQCSAINASVIFGRTELPGALPPFLEGESLGEGERKGERVRETRAAAAGSMDARSAPEERWR